MARVRVFIACSLDGFIAGPADELDWLPPHAADGAEDTFTPFFARIGALLMGRRTYDVVEGFGGPWPYGDTPVLVATSRPMSPKNPSVRPVGGTIDEMVSEARMVAGERDVYIDGGTLIRAALDTDLIDDLTVTVVPVILGRGLPLFAGSARRHRLELRGAREIGGGLVELRYRPARTEADGS